MAEPVIPLAGHFRRIGPEPELPDSLFSYIGSDFRLIQAALGRRTNESLAEAFTRYRRDFNESGFVASMEAFNMPTDVIRSTWAAANGYGGKWNPGKPYNPYVDDREKITNLPREVWDELLKSDSPQETDWIIQRYRDKMMWRDKAAEGGWVWNMVAGALDPIALVPVPLLKGGQMARQAMKGSAAFGGSVGASELIRWGLDPTMTAEEAGISVAFASGLGGVFGAAMSKVKVRPWHDERWNELQAERHKMDFHTSESVLQRSAVKSTAGERKSLSEIDAAERSLLKSESILNDLDRKMATDREPIDIDINVETVVGDVPANERVRANLDAVTDEIEEAARIGDWRKPVTVGSYSDFLMGRINTDGLRVKVITDHITNSNPRAFAFEEADRFIIMFRDELLETYDTQFTRNIIAHEVGHLIDYNSRIFSFGRIRLPATDVPRTGPRPQRPGQAYQTRLRALWNKDGQPGVKRAKGDKGKAYREWLADNYAIWRAEKSGHGLHREFVIRSRAKKKHAEFIDWVELRATKYGERQSRGRVQEQVAAKKARIDKLKENHRNKYEVDNFDDMPGPMKGDSEGARPMTITHAQAEEMRRGHLIKERDHIRAKRVEFEEQIKAAKAAVKQREKDIKGAKGQRAKSKIERGNSPKRGANPSLDDLKKQVGELEGQRTMIDDKLNEYDMILDGDARDFRIAPTGVGVERMLEVSKQFPYYHLLNNDLLTQLPLIGKQWSMMAAKMTGAPGVMFQFAKEGQAVGTNVHSAAKIWNHNYTTAWRGMVDEYYKMIGRTEAPSDFAVVAKDTGQAFSRAWRNVSNNARRMAGKEDLPVDVGRPMTIAEFEDEVGKVLFGGDAVNEFVEAAAKPWAKFYEEFADAMAEQNMFANPRIINTRITNLKSRIRKTKRAIKNAKSQDVKDELTDIWAAQQRQLEDLQDTLDEMSVFPERYVREDFGMPRIWLAQLMMEDDVAQSLRGTIRKSLVARGGHFSMGGKRFPVTDDIAVEAFLDETMLNLRKQIDFEDSVGSLRGHSFRDYMELRLQSVNERIALAEGDELAKLELRAAEIERRLENPTESMAGAAPSFVLRRTLDFVDNKDLLPYLDTNVARVSAHYMHRVAPLIETSRKYGDMRAADALDDLWFHTLETIDQMPKAKQAAALEAARKANDDFIKIRDIVQGNHGMPKNPDAWSERTGNMALALAGMQWMGKAVFTNMLDTGMMSTVAGWRPLFRTWWSHFNKEDWMALPADEVRLAGLIHEQAAPTRAQQIVEAGGLGFDTAMRHANQVINRAAGRFYFLNGMNTFTDYARTVTGSLVQSKMIEKSIRWLDGDLSAKEIALITRSGMTKRMARDFVDNWKAAGSGQKNVDGFTYYFADTPHWKNEAAIRNFRNILQTEVDNIVITPGPASKPTAFTSTVWGKIFGQFRGFGMDATQKIMISGLQRKDKEMAIGMASMIAMGIMLDWKRRPDYIDLGPDEMIMRGIELSGVLGIFSDINMMVEQASAGELGVRPLFGMRPVVDASENWARQIGGIAGAAPQTWLNLLWAFTSEDAGNHERARAIRFIMPFQNHFMLSSFSKEMEGNLETAMDYVTE